MKNDIVYIVAGFSRTGSSMMMACLNAGGIPTYYDEQGDALLRQSAPDNYDPNPNGFYQNTPGIGAYFYAMNVGMAVKLYFADLMHLPPGKYKVVFLKRNPEEIRASMHRWTPYTSWGNEESATYVYDQIMTAVAALAGLQITFLNYSDVVADPVHELSKLSDWGFDVQKAAAVVDPALYRLKLEEK